MCTCIWLHRQNFNCSFCIKSCSIFISFTTVTGAPVAIASASFTLIFSLTTRIIKKLLSITINKKKQGKVLFLVNSKLNSIRTWVSRALIGMEISHEEFNTILNKKEKYEKMKEEFKTVKR